MILSFNANDMIAEKIHIREIVGGRFDNAFVLFNHRALNSKYPVYPLKHFLIGKPQYGAGEIGVPRTNVDSPRYIRITDIDENGSLIDNIGVTANSIDNKYILNNNDILIARSGNTVGKSYIHKTNIIKETCIFAGYLIRFVIDESQILPDYVFIFTKLSAFSDWVKVTQRVTGQPNINAEEYSNLLLPVPPIEVQQEIVDFYSNALQTRLDKRQEATKLINSIDDYLFDFLRVNKNLYEIDERHVFVNSISSMIGKRLDVSFYSNKFEMVSTLYPNEELSVLVEIDPTISFNNLDPDMAISFVPMESIDEQYGEIKGCKETSISKTKGYTKFEENDLLWAKITPCMQNGKSAIARDLINGRGCGSTEYFVMRPKDDSVLIEYIYLLLRHHSVLNAAQSSFGGSAGQQRVSSQYIKSIRVPKPDVNVQKEIVSTAFTTKQKAKSLQIEGNTLLNTAIHHIESLIIG